MKTATRWSRAKLHRTSHTGRRAHDDRPSRTDMRRRSGKPSGPTKIMRSGSMAPRVPTARQYPSQFGSVRLRLYALVSNAAATCNASSRLRACSQSWITCELLRHRDNLSPETGKRQAARGDCLRIRRSPREPRSSAGKEQHSVHCGSVAVNGHGLTTDAGISQKTLLSPNSQPHRKQYQHGRELRMNHTGTLRVRAV